jgi:hypothetical protein
MAIQLQTQTRLHLSEELFSRDSNKKNFPGLFNVRPHLKSASELEAICPSQRIDQKKFALLSDAAQPRISTIEEDAARKILLVDIVNVAQRRISTADDLAIMKLLLADLEQRRISTVKDIAAAGHPVSLPVPPALTLITVPAAGNANKSSFKEAKGGINYLTRYPQGISSALDTSCVEALGSVVGFTGVGNVVESVFAFKAARKTLNTISNSEEIQKKYTDDQLHLEASHEAWLAAPQEEGISQQVCEAAQEALKSRTAQNKLDLAKSQAAEHLTDGVRYTAVSWTARVFSILKLTLKAVTWIGMAASIIGVVGGGLQFISGLFKWHSAQKLTHSAKLALQHIKHMISNHAPISDEVPSMVGDIDTQLQAHLMRHVQVKRERVRQKAKDKRLKAKIETAAGAGAIVFGVLAFAFPPLGLGTVAIGLAYAGYRIYKGVGSYYSTKAEKQKELELNLDFTSGSFASRQQEAVQSINYLHKVDSTLALTLEQLGLVQKNPYYAVHYLVESMHQGELPWLQAFLIELGIPEENAQAVSLLAQSNDVVAARKMLENMLFSENWLA